MSLFCLRNRLCIICHIAWLLAVTPAYAAPSCSFRSVSSVSFGAYDVFSTLANNNGVGSLSVKCTGGANSVISLSTGQSNNFTNRLMRSGANTLNYNLYTSTAHAQVWGDGSGGSSVTSTINNGTFTLNIFGQIPARQDVAVGIYTDNITVTVSF
jgi:spore coat protein U-like protein